MRAELMEKVAAIVERNQGIKKEAAGSGASGNLKVPPSQAKEMAGKTTTSDVIAASTLTT